MGEQRMLLVSIKNGLLALAHLPQQALALLTMGQVPSH